MQIFCRLIRLLVIQINFTPHVTEILDPVAPLKFLLKM
jgi:hypothetical protein